jgi:hypothetical protein
MPKIKARFVSDADVSFGYDTFHVDADGFAEVSQETKRHILSSQPGLWIDPDTEPVLAQMFPVTEATQKARSRMMPDPEIVRANTPGVSTDVPATPVEPAAESGS